MLRQSYHTRRATPDLLNGPILPKILSFILPLILTNLLQTFYHAADMMVVQFSGVSGAIGAIGTCGAMLGLLVNIFIGFSVGANVVVAREIGKGNRGTTQRAVHTAMFVSAIFGVLALIVGVSLSGRILILLGDQGEVLRMATLYSRIYCLGAPAMCVTNYAAAILRAKGDTKTPLMVLSISGASNVAMNLFFVLILGMNVDGVATATVLSNVFSAAWMVTCLIRDPGWCQFRWRKLRISRPELADILRVGIPAGIQNSMYSISNMLLQSSIVSLNNAQFPGGSAIIDGNAAATSLEAFIYVATNSVYQAAVTFVSQHFGAGRFGRMKKVIRESYLVSFCIALICGAFFTVFARELLHLYIQDETSIRIGMERMMIVMPTYFLLGLMETSSGVLRGLGRSAATTVIAFLGICILRILWVILIVPLKPTYPVIMLSYPVSWILTLAAQYFFCLHVRRRLPADDLPAKTAKAP